jgi:hypothetical protein
MTITLDFQIPAVTFITYQTLVSAAEFPSSMPDEQLDYSHAHREGQVLRSFEANAHLESSWNRYRCFGEVRLDLGVFRD